MDNKNDDTISNSDSDEEVEIPVELPNEKKIDTKKEIPEAPVVEKKKRKNKSRIDPATGDKRRTAGAANLVKARAARQARIAAAKAAAANQYVVESSDDEDSEIVLEKKKKAPVITKDQERMLKLELMMEKLLIQEKIKGEKKPKKVIQINIPPQEKKEPTINKEQLRKLLDL